MNTVPTILGRDSLHFCICVKKLLAFVSFCCVNILYVFVPFDYSKLKKMQVLFVIVSHLIAHVKYISNVF